MSTPEKVPHILVIDDDPELQKLVAQLLSRAKMTSVSAMTATEGAKILREQTMPDLIVLDMMLPEITGIEFLRQMRAKTVFQNLPVVILSAVVDPEQIREALDAGADRYITKPYLVSNLVKTIQELLKNGRPIRR